MKLHEHHVDVWIVAAAVVMNGKIHHMPERRVGVGHFTRDLLP